MTRAPIAATPTALPIERANMLAPVTTPRSPHSTLAWAAMRLGAATNPRPSPTTKHAAPIPTTDGFVAASARPAVPSTVTPQPMSTVVRNPSRR